MIISSYYSPLRAVNEQRSVPRDRLSTPPESTGVVLLPHCAQPQVQAIPQALHPSEAHRHQRPAARLSQDPHASKFHFFHPVRKEHSTTQFVLDVLSPVAETAIDIPIESIVSVIPMSGHHNAHGERDSNRSEGGVVTKNGLDDNGPEFSHALPHHRVNRVERKAKPKRQPVVDNSPSDASRQHANRFRSIAVECKQTEDAHMEARRRHKFVRRSNERHGAMHERQADDWRRVCDSTVELAHDRESIEDLYRNKLSVPQMSVGITPPSQKRSVSHSPGRSAPNTTFDTESSILAGAEGDEKSVLLPRLIAVPKASPTKPISEPSPPLPLLDPRYLIGASPARSGHCHAPSIVARASTQDTIAAMERRYQLELERDIGRAERQAAQEERARVRLEEEVVEARHIVHQSMALDRRRDEAKRRAEHLQQQKIQDISQRIAEREANINFRKFRNRPPPTHNHGEGLGGFHLIAQRRTQEYDM